MNESTMPVAEWGSHPPVIPYSPWFHISATAFALLPMPLEMTGNLLSAVLDCSRILLIALLGRIFNLGRRISLLAGVLYGLLPVTFLLHAWGNLPTMYGMWWELVAMIFLVAAWSRLHRFGPWLALVVLFTIALLYYTVTGIFLGIFIALFLGFWLIAQRWKSARGLPERGWYVVLGFGSAFVASMLIYYGQYVQPMIERTLPYVLTVSTKGSEAVGVERLPFRDYLLSYIPHLDYQLNGGYLYYGILLPLLFVLPGYLFFRKKPLAWAMLTAWFCVGTLFLLAGYRISMVDKQLFFILPAVMLCWAIYAMRYLQRGWAGRVLITMTYLFTFVSAVSLWLIRIARSPSL